MALYDQNWDINSYNQAYGNNNLDTQFQGEGDIMRYMDQDYNYRPPGSFLPSGIGSFYNTPYPGSDYSPHRGFEEIQFDETVQDPEKTGSNFNFLNLLTAPFNKGIGLAKKGMEFIGERFQRPEAKQAEWDALRSVTDQYGTYRTGTLPSGQEARIIDNKISVRDPVTGAVILRDKNFDSIVGSESVKEMLDKKEDWAQGRFEKFGDTWTDDEHKGISKALYDYYKSTGALAKWRGDPGQTIADKISSRVITEPPGFITRDRGTYTGPKTYDYNPQQAARTTHWSERPDTSGSPQRGFVNPGAGSYGPHKGSSPSTSGGKPGTTGSARDWAKGGRVGLYAGGDPEETTEDIFEFMQDQNIPHGEMASDDNNTRILENLFEKYLELGFSPEEAEIKAMEEFQLMSQGQDFDMGTQNEQGIASLV